MHLLQVANFWTRDTFFQKNAVSFIQALFINVQSIAETRPVKRISKVCRLCVYTFSSLGVSAFSYDGCICFVGERVEEWIYLQFGGCRVFIKAFVHSFVRSFVRKQCNTLWIKPDSYAANVLKSMYFHLYAHCVSHVMYWLFSAWGAIACHAYATRYCVNINTVVNNMALFWNVFSSSQSVRAYWIFHEIHLGDGSHRNEQTNSEHSKSKCWQH